LFLLASTGPLFSACDADDAHPLSANAWVLTSAVDHGVPVDVSTDIVWRFLEGGCGTWDDSCPDGPKLVGNDVCNDFIRNLRYEDDIAVWGDYWAGTAVGCSGGLSDTLSGFFHGESFRYTIAGDQLRLSSPSDTVDLTFQASDSD
jgi:hypothetical protein